MNKLKIISLQLLVLFFLIPNSRAQEIENNFKTRTSVELSFEPLKDVKFNFIPELRFDDKFALNKYLFEGELEYEPIKFLSLAATYRFGGNLKENEDTEYFNRFALSAKVSKKFSRFESSFRLRYTNDADDDINNENFLRYKASVKYDIPKSKITPFIAIEAFQSLTNENLYKMRYSTGVDFKLFKKNYLGLDYKFDYFRDEYKNNHILSVGYKIKF